MHCADMVQLLIEPQREKLLKHESIRKILLVYYDRKLNNYKIK